MPLLDHFHAPLHPRRHWESFHVTWAGAIADVLNESLLPEGYFAEEHAHAGARIEIDVATFAEDSAGGVATRTYAPPAPPLVVPAAFPDEFEVRVYEAEGGARLVAAIELVSPANKDRATHRRRAGEQVRRLPRAGHRGDRGRCGHEPRAATFTPDVLRLLGQADTGLPADAALYAVAYRPLVRDGAEVIEMWPSPLAVGRDLPTLPLALNAELCLPIDLEATYTAACGRRRLG